MSYRLLCTDILESLHAKTHTFYHVATFRMKNMLTIYYLLKEVPECSFGALKPCSH